MYIIVFITVPNKKEAEDIAKELLKNKLCSCVNILDKVESFFWWEGKIDRAEEFLLIVKSKKGKFSQIVRAVKSRHSYQVPELIAVDISCGYKPYLSWISDCVSKFH